MVEISAKKVPDTVFFRVNMTQYNEGRRERNG